MDFPGKRRFAIVGGEGPALPGGDYGGAGDDDARRMDFPGKRRFAIVGGEGPVLLPGGDYGGAGDDDARRMDFPGKRRFAIVGDTAVPGGVSWADYGGVGNEDGVGAVGGGEELIDAFDPYGYDEQEQEAPPSSFFDQMVYAQHVPQMHQPVYTYRRVELDTPTAQEIVDQADFLVEDESGPMAGEEDPHHLRFAHESEFEHRVRDPFTQEVIAQDGLREDKGYFSDLSSNPFAAEIVTPAKENNATLRALLQRHPGHRGMYDLVLEERGGVDLLDRARRARLEVQAGRGA